MNLPLALFAVAVCVAACLLICVIRKLCKRNQLPAGLRTRLQAHWHKASAMRDPARRVIEAEKVLDELLAALGFAGSFGEKLRAAGPRVQGAQAVWDAHKLRNRLAHELGANASEREAEQALSAFQHALSPFLHL